MDTVIGNKYINVFNELNIDVSKRLTGEYTVEEIISTFDNFFFNKMFLDITSIKDYTNMANLKKLSMAINMDKVILLLDANDVLCNSKQFLSKLVSMGIYNFTSDVSGLMYLYNNPNSYRDVAYLQELEESRPAGEIKVNLGSSNNISHGAPISNNKTILGVKNVTASAGSTTLTYLLMKALSGYYNVKALEIDKKEFIYFKDEDAISINEANFSNTIKKYDDVDFFVVDLGKSNKDHLCSDVIYLVEPSTIKLNKLMLINPNVFSKLSGKKIVLNKSLLNDSDIANFEVEARADVFYNLEPLNDKENCNDKLFPLLGKLGYINYRKNDDDDDDNFGRRGLFGLFKGK